MEIGTLRDIVISILGILYIILTIGLIVGLIIAYLKLRKYMNSINNKIRIVRRWVAYGQGLVKGLNESVSAFRRGGI
jgi:ABC-type glucose/galactose transport system permease subunit